MSDLESEQNAERVAVHYDLEGGFTSADGYRYDDRVCGVGEDNETVSANLADVTCDECLREMRERPLRETAEELLRMTTCPACGSIDWLAEEVRGSTIIVRCDDCSGHTTMVKLPQHNDGSPHG